MSVKIKAKELKDEDVINSAVHNTITGHSRLKYWYGWSIQHSIIFKWKDGKFYRAHYSTGATEMQDESPWEYYDEVECTEVEQKPVTALQWVEKAV